MAKMPNLLFVAELVSSPQVFIFELLFFGFKHATPQTLRRDTQ